ncbi:hypothetical protein M3I54_22755 [Paraburkholderia sp. CNPSo 3274]|uniref:hypothetical protein n=1 Tax=Paraburkholderia sp. CNPSo 3274 TaxID=2940932 RepID=UPI0020B67ADF|nr:hypothetical protein [Paraburkholderia sp. CNPSo 3274]MCP3709768.1 hypothetical protein [Paraburkholderia sp. CNPSo 3274]
MYIEIKEVMAKITSVTPIMEKHGKKKKRPAHSIIFEFAMPNTVLDAMDGNGLREAFYRKPKSASVDPKSGQSKLDVSNVADGISQLKFSWWQQWIDIPGELTGWNLTLHTGNTERSHIVLDEAKVSSFATLPKDLGIALVKCKAIVHPTAHEKGKIDELLQTEVKISILPPDTQQAELPGTTTDQVADGDDEEEAEEGNEAAATAEAFSGSDATASDASETATLGEPPKVDPFAGTELARGAVNSDAKVTTKKSRSVGPEGEQDSRKGVAWPFPGDRNAGMYTPNGEPKNTEAETAE